MKKEEIKLTNEEKELLKHYQDKELKLITQTNNWRSVALICLVVLFLSLLLNLVQIRQVKKIPYIVTINSITGQVKEQGMLTNIRYKPSNVVIKTLLNNLIVSTQSVPLDPVVLNQTIEKAYFFMTPTMQVKFGQFITNKGT
ncbi:MAG: VirB8/TrbF family protein, partial [Kangiellaceae bacterium]|nr:VirB8/TrbF family protein [Kangiellaceae bacterium]